MGYTQWFCACLEIIFFNHYPYKYRHYMWVRLWLSALFLFCELHYLSFCLFSLHLSLSLPLCLPPAHSDSIPILCFAPFSLRRACPIYFAFVFFYQFPAIPQIDQTPVLNAFDLVFSCATGLHSVAEPIVLLCLPL